MGSLSDSADSFEPDNDPGRSENSEPSPDTSNASCCSAESPESAVSDTDPRCAASDGTAHRCCCDE